MEEIEGFRYRCRVRTAHLGCYITLVHLTLEGLRVPTEIIAARSGFFHAAVGSGRSGAGGQTDNYSTIFVVSADHLETVVFLLCMSWPTYCLKSTQKKWYNSLLELSNPLLVGRAR